MKDFLIQIYYDDFVKEIDLSKISKGKISIGSDESNDIVLNSNNVMRTSFELEKDQGRWAIIDPNKTAIIYNGRNFDKKYLENKDVYEIAGYEKGSNRMIVSICQNVDYDKTFEAFDISQLNAVRIGGDADCHIQFKSLGNEESLLFRIYRENESHFIGDVHKNAKNKNNLENLKKAVFINGRRIYSDFQLKNNDLIYIGGHEIIFRDQYIKKNIEKYEVHDHQTYLEITDIGKGLEVKGIFPFNPTQFDKETSKEFEIQSRIFANYPNQDVTMPSPRQKMTKPQINWISIALPMILMAVVYMVVMPILSKNGGGSNGVMLLAFSGVGLITAVVNYLSQIGKFKSDGGRRIEEYEKKLSSIRNQLCDLQKQEIEALFRVHSDFCVCGKVVETKERRLWERSYLHEDFLDVKIGQGDRPLSIKINAPEQSEQTIEKDELIDQAILLKNEFKMLQNVPTTISLQKMPLVCVLGDHDQTQNVLKTMITQLATNHSYQEVKMVFILSEEDQKEWDWVRWLPHAWDNSKQYRYIGFTSEDIRNLLTHLGEVIRERADHEKGMKTFNLPHYVFFITNRDHIQNDPIVEYLLEPNDAMGISTIFALRDTEWVPPHCKCEVRMDYLKGEAIFNGNRKNTILFNTENITHNQAEEFSRELAPIAIKNMTSSTNMPTYVSLLNILGAKHVEDLQILEKWEMNEAFKSMAVPIGIKLNGDVIQFNIHEKEHGPHGLIAGTTGSGKSETILAFLISLAVHYHPDYVGFVVIDYKGGGLINDIHHLPHLLGSITNLDENQIQRSLLSLKSELKRRQRCFEKYKINHIDTYQKLFKEKVADEPLPHLILVVDEFAELKADQPDFMKELISAARIGRSLGIHLILATQKPSGIVDDQIWSNSKFKICLKVSTPQDSQEVLKRTEAAYITVPGRGYLQVGNDEMFELFQSAYGGKEYQVEGDEILEPSLYVVDMNGRREKIYPRAVIKKENDSLKETQINRIVDHIHGVFKENNFKPVKGPWLPPIASKYHLNEYIEKDLLEYDRPNFRVSIGIYDNPMEQAQGIFSIDLVSSGSIAIVGGASTGKTTLIQTMIMYLIRTYKPSEVHIYAMDFGSRILSIFENAPHVGGVILSEEQDRLERLLDHLKKVLDTRKKVFTEVGVTNIKSYNKIDEKYLPAVIIFIDNIVFIKERQDKGYDERITSLIREGMNYGIYFVVTGTATSSIPHKVLEVIQTRFALQLAEKSDYNLALGETPSIIPNKIKGRAIGKLGHKLTEIQVFLPENGKEEHEITQNIRLSIFELSNIVEKTVFKVPALKEKINISDCQSLNDPNGYCLPIGVSVGEVENVNVYLEDFGGFIISGSRKSGLTNTLKIILQGIIGNYSDTTKIVVLDNFTGELEEYKDRVQYLSDVNTLEEDINNLNQEIQSTERSDRYIFIINDLDYLIKRLPENTKNVLADILNNALYTRVNAFITVRDGAMAGYDDFIRAVKKINTGLVLGYCEDGWNQLGMKINYDERKKPYRVGQGYLMTVREFNRIQTYYDAGSEKKNGKYND